MNERQRQIFAFIREAEDYITASDLAAMTGCSERTVRNDILQIREELQRTGKGTLVSKKNKGYWFETGTDAPVMTLPEEAAAERPEGHFSGYDGYMDEVDLIIARVMHHGPVKMSDLEERIFTNYKNVSRRVDEAQAWFEQCHMELIRRRGMGIALEGTSHRRRMTEWAFYCRLLGKVKEAPLAEDALSEYWPGMDMNGIMRCIVKMEEQFDFHLSYGGFEHLAFLTAAMIAGQRRKAEYAFPIADISESTWEWQAGEFYLKLLKDMYRIRIDNQERRYMWFAVASSEVMDFADAAMRRRNREEKSRYAALAAHLIASVGGILQKEMSDDQILADGLINYISALNTDLLYGCGGRIKSRQQPSNGNFPEIEVACQSAAHIMEEALDTVVTREVTNNLVSHFAGAVRRHIVTARVYIVCTYGVGVSRFLGEQIKGHFPNIQIADILTPRDIRQGKLKEPYDLILTTVDLQGGYKGRLHRIGSYMSLQDVRQLDRRLSALEQKRQQTGQGPSGEAGEGYRLFDPRLIIRSGRKWSKAELIHEMCLKLRENGCVTEAFEASVLHREDISSTLLAPGIAIPHGFARDTIVSRIAVAFLEKPVMWNEYNEADIVFMLAINMKDRPEVQKAVKAFYRSLITMIEDEGMCRRLTAPADNEETARELNLLCAD